MVTLVHFNMCILYVDTSSLFICKTQIRPRDQLFFVKFFGNSRRKTFTRNKRATEWRERKGGKREKRHYKEEHIPTILSPILKLTTCLPILQSNRSWPVQPEKNLLYLERFSIAKVKKNCCWSHKHEQWPHWDAKLLSPLKLSAPWPTSA